MIMIIISIEIKINHANSAIVPVADVIKEYTDLLFIFGAVSLALLYKNRLLALDSDYSIILVFY